MSTSNDNNKTYNNKNNNNGSNNNVNDDENDNHFKKPRQYKRKLSDSSSTESKSTSHSHSESDSDSGSATDSDLLAVNNNNAQHDSHSVAHNNICSVKIEHVSARDLRQLEERFNGSKSQQLETLISNVLSINEIKIDATIIAKDGNLVVSDVIAELNLCNLSSQQNEIGPILRKPLPVERTRAATGMTVECLYLRDPIESQYPRLVSAMLNSAGGSADQDHQVVALAQVSGAGKTKIAFDCGIQASRYKKLIAICIKMNEGNGSNLRVTCKALSEIIKRCYEQLECPENTSIEDKRYRYAWLTAWATRLVVIFILSHVHTIKQIYQQCRISSEWNNDLAPYIGEAVIRAQRHPKFDSLMLEEFQSRITYSVQADVQTFEILYRYGSKKLILYLLMAGFSPMMK